MSFFNGGQIVVVVYVRLRATTWERRSEDK
jgi:hypothetical protein